MNNKCKLTKEELDTLPRSTARRLQVQRGGKLEDLIIYEINQMDINAESFKAEYLCEWTGPSKEYQEAYKLWLWYNYRCELYDSKVCTGKNEYEDYMPASSEEYRLSASNASNNLRIIQDKRNKLKEKGIYINGEDWQSAKKHFSRYKLKALEEEYKYYFKD
jgi:hypothetical protein